MARAMLTERTAAHGPKRMATRVPQTAWPVVPPGIGMLNIMARNEKAAAMPRRGIFSAGTVSRTRRTAWAQTGTMTRPNTPQVEGLR